MTTDQRPDLAKLKVRLDRLRDLAKHPKTPKHERTLAQEAYDRLSARIQAEASQRYEDTRWYGEKYQATRDLSVTQIAKLIRDEIKFIRKTAAATQAGEEAALSIVDPIGEAPASIRISVRTRHHSAIDIELTGVPQEWGWVRGTDYRAPWMGEHWMHTPKLEALMDELKVMLSAYNYNGDNAMFDHFDSRFYTSVRIAWEETPRD